MEMITNFAFHRFPKLKEGKERFIGFLLQGCMVRQNSSVILCGGILPFLFMGLILED